MPKRVKKVLELKEELSGYWICYRLHTEKKVTISGWFKTEAPKHSAKLKIPYH